MAKITTSLIRRLQARTGADAVDCRQALQRSDGDLEQAAALLFHFSLGTTLRNQFLVAMPSLQDDHFSHTVSLVCEHNDKGAIGLVINRPTDLALAAMLEQMGIAHEAIDESALVLWGGPVQPERGFVVHGSPGGWDSSMQLDDELFVTTSRDVLAAVGRGEGPREFFVALGYAGWDAGQLENEIKLNTWLNTPVDRRVMFATAPSTRWQAATRLLGVDVTQLTDAVGHA